DSDLSRQKKANIVAVGMSNSLQNLLTTTIVILSMTAGVLAQDVHVGPITLTVAVLGVDVAVPVEGDVAIATADGAFSVALSAHANLAELQAKALPIVRALSLPRDNCAKPDLNPVVNSVDSASLQPGPDHSVLVAMSGDVTLWECGKVL